MSRSHRNNKIFANFGKTEKFDKTNANKKLRNLVKVRIKKGFETLPILKEVSDVWAFAKDGKHYWAGATKKDMSK
jgi:hypothetical protein